MTARKFVSSYPLETRGTGLLLTGSIGVGKTHLAVGVLQALIEERSASGLFCHYHDLLTQVRNSYNREVNGTELEVLRPIFEAEVLVLDELGASKPTDWVWDTVSQILNTRYNERRTTILTTNYVNSAPLGMVIEANALQRARAATREEILGGPHRGRYEKSAPGDVPVVEMSGLDFRQTVNLARIG